MNSTVSLSFRYLEIDYVRALRAHYASHFRLRLDIVVTVVLAIIGAYLWRSPSLHLLGLACVVAAVAFALMLVAAFTVIPPLAFRREPNLLATVAADRAFPPAVKQMAITSTPKRKWVVWLLALGYLFSQPVVERVYYETNLRRGAYPPEADSIGIPIMQFMFGWFVTLPVVLGFIWFALREYPGAVSLLAYNAVRPVWSAVWSSLLLLAAGYYVYFAIRSAVSLFPLDAVHALLTVYLLLCFRSSLVYSSVFKSPIDKAQL